MLFLVHVTRDISMQQRERTQSQKTRWNRENTILNDRLMCDFLRILFSNLWCVGSKCHTKCGEDFHLPLFGARDLTIYIYVIFRAAAERLLDLNKNVKFIIIWNGNDDDDDDCRYIDANLMSKPQSFACVWDWTRQERPHQWHSSLCVCVGECARVCL